MLDSPLIRHHWCIPYSEYVATDDLLLSSFCAVCMYLHMADKPYITVPEGHGYNVLPYKELLYYYRSLSP